MQHLIVPVDDPTRRGVRSTLPLPRGARRCDGRRDRGRLRRTRHPRDRSTPQRTARSSRHRRRAVTTHVRVAAESVAQVLGNEVEQHPEVTVVLASHGRGRSAALLGSVTEELLERIFGPVLVVGPHVTNSKFDGPIIVTVDGSDPSESVLPLAAAWGIELGVEPWIVEVAEPGTSNRPTSATRPIRLASHGR